MGVAMDLFPLYNSIRISLISTVIVFFSGILISYFVSKTPRIINGILDVLFTLPLVLPPTVVGFLLIKLLGPKYPLGKFFLNIFGLNLTMNWWSAIFATVVIIFPLMYRTSRGAFQSFDSNLSDTAKTLGLSNTYIFWRIMIPYSKQGIVAGAVLSFARALGEYGATSMIAGYIPEKTATISTTVYQLWQTGNDELAFSWIIINILISGIVLLVINLLETNYQQMVKNYVSKR